MDQNLCCLQEKFIKDLFVSEGLGAVIDEASYGYAIIYFLIILFIFLPYYILELF